MSFFGTCHAPWAKKKRRHVCIIPNKITKTAWETSGGFGRNSENFLLSKEGDLLQDFALARVIASDHPGGCCYWKGDHSNLYHVFFLYFLSLSHVVYSLSQHLTEVAKLYQLKMMVCQTCPPELPDDQLVGWELRHRLGGNQRLPLTSFPLCSKT